VSVGASRGPAGLRVFERHAVVPQGVVLELDAADVRAGADDDVLSDPAVLADARPIHHAGDLPDHRALADFGVVVDERSPWVSSAWESAAGQRAKIRVKLTG
jgi:hypothetical protein